VHIQCGKDGIRYAGKFNQICIALLLKNRPMMITSGIRNELLVLLSLQAHLDLSLIRQSRGGINDVGF
jgi:hypothetical protein